MCPTRRKRRRTGEATTSLSLCLPRRLKQASHGQSFFVILCRRCTCRASSGEHQLSNAAHGRVRYCLGFPASLCVPVPVFSCATSCIDCLIIAAGRRYVQTRTQVPPAPSRVEHLPDRHRQRRHHRRWRRRVAARLGWLCRGQSAARGGARARATPGTAGLPDTHRHDAHRRR